MDQLGACRADLRARLSDHFLRLNSLYWITDKEGKKTKFRMNWAQEALFDELHFQNVILKARQLGFTTFIQIFMLDACLFNSNIRAGTIAHTLIDAQAIFRDKVRFPYDSLPDSIKAAVPVTKDSATELMLANNSSIRVGTSLRSGTLQYLHISEYGKLCAKYPEKAREVRTGALNTIQAGQLVFIESTAEGQEGHYYDICEMAQAKRRSKEQLSALDFKFFFFPWYENPDYELDPDGIVIPDQFVRYFDSLEKKHGIKLSPRKKAWYVKKAETQLSDMKREYPSTPQEAFEASVEGAYYAEQMATADLQQRIGGFPHIPGIPVETAWDIGIGDTNSIWFFQRIGPRFRFILYMQGVGEGLPFYARELKKLHEESKWEYGAHYWPHDGVVDEWGSGKSRIEQARDLLMFPHIVPRMAVDDGINAVRTVLPHCEFDAAGCAEGLKALRSYRKEWDEERATWRDKPRHDWASHGADAFRVFASRYKDIPARPVAPKPQDTLTYEVKPDGRVLANMSVMDIVQAKMRKKRND